MLRPLITSFRTIRAYSAFSVIEKLTNINTISDYFHCRIEKWTPWSPHEELNIRYDPPKAGGNCLVWPFPGGGELPAEN